jgi:hypothetical protein
MDATGDHHVEQDKPSSEKEISHFCSCVESRPKNNNENDDNDNTT